MKIRVRKGQTRPIIGCEIVPEWPEYVEVSAPYLDGTRALVEQGVLEYAPREAAAVAPVAPAKVDTKGFAARKPARG